MFIQVLTMVPSSSELVGVDSSSFMTLLLGTMRELCPWLLCFFQLLGFLSSSEATGVVLTGQVIELSHTDSLSELLLLKIGVDCGTS